MFVSSAATHRPPAIAPSSSLRRLEAQVLVLTRGLGQSPASPTELMELQSVLMTRQVLAHRMLEACRREGVPAPDHVINPLRALARQWLSE